MTSKTLAILLLIFVFGYLLRVVFLPANILTFGYDQARDAVFSLDIVEGDLKIFGPPASQSGLFHGVLYYYVLAPFYALGGGSPIAAAYGIALINVLGVLVIYYFGWKMTKSSRVGLLAAFLYAISFEATQYATWLSNPTLGIITVPLMYLGLWLWTQPLPGTVSSKLTAPLITALGLGLSIQAEVFLIYHIFPLLIWLYFARKNISKRQLIIFVITFLIAVSTMILAQLKFGLLPTIEALKNLTVQNTDLAYQKSLGDYLVLYLNQIGRIFSFNSYPGNVGWGGGFVITLIALSILKARKSVNSINPKLFLSSWLLSHLSIVTVGGTSTPFLMVGIGLAVSLIIAIYLFDWWKAKYKILVIGILTLIVFGNLSTIFEQNKKAATLFAIQKDMRLDRQLAAIDYTYNSAYNKQFSVNSLTSPLWINIVWSYLYKWHGQQTYGYLPSFTGRDQIGIADSLPNDDGLPKDHYLILEPMGGIPTRYLQEILDQENAVSNVLEEKFFGELTIQKRSNDKTK